MNKNYIDNSINRRIMGSLKKDITLNKNLIIGNKNKITNYS